jgi:nucleotide-binding universal stress UspA family protein
MSTISHILFPIDFSERCKAVEPFVQATARRFHAKLTLLHAVPYPLTRSGGFEAPPYPVLTDITPALEDARSRLAALFDSPEFVQVDRVVEQGDPSVLITTFAKENGVDLIMMPTHGYGGFRALLLGSVTAKVLHDAKCAVWTAAHLERGDIGSHVDCRNILCAVDLAPENVDTIRHAASLANDYGAQLRLVHAIPSSEARPQKYLDSEFRQHLFQASRDEIATMQQKVGTDVEMLLEGGDVSKAVRAAALQQNSDLLVIGRGRIHETFGRLRTNAYAIIRDSPCPVLSM